MLHQASFSAGFLPTQRFTETRFGTQITTRGTRFRLWAPHRSAVFLKLEADGIHRPMQSQPRGWYELEVEGVGHGDRYRFVLDDGTEVPDPASRFQPEDVLGPSEVVDPRRFAWTDVGWIGRPWEEAVIYELHLGTFTPEGTFAAATERLDYLVSLGVTAIELMPVNDFPGRWNWGYDGALVFAPDASYGRPDDLKTLVASAHERGLMVLLDVVYNHFGPKGNFLPHYAPVFTDKHHTPWGQAINFDGEDSPTVRDFILANARYWLTEYHFDGLRLDAVHEIKDEGFNHMLHDLALLIRGSTDGRNVHLILENEDKDTEWLRRTVDLVPGLYDAQWDDDVHHAIEAVLLGERSVHFEKYGKRPDLLGKALAEGFAYENEKAAETSPSRDLPPISFVCFLQNHDQVGNRPLGKRLSMLVDKGKLRAVTALYLLSPHIPMLFMGEEWGSRRPFLFVSDIEPELREPIREHRRSSFKVFVPEELIPEEIPHPMDEETFIASKLDWAEPEQAAHAEWLSFYRELLSKRREIVVPLLGGVGGGYGRYEVIAGRGVRVDWELNGGRLSAVLNLTDAPLPVDDLRRGETVWLEGAADGDTLQPWSVLFTLEPTLPEAT
ncbi:MAG TPA: malto-oligosyltrehalose trehalohydrolase [Devosia sp.]|nr:malto-oligosyltrehalose trehalohydrolase [Devosia sp.]